MNNKYLIIIAYAAFSIGILVFGKYSVESLDWYGIDIPGIEYAEDKASDIEWMLEKAEEGSMASPEFETYNSEIKRIKKNKMMFSMTGLIACIAGLVTLLIRHKATTE